MVLICFIDSSKLFTLVLRSRGDAYENELGSLSSIVYGEPDKEEKQFDLSNNSWEYLLANASYQVEEF